MVEKEIKIMLTSCEYHFLKNYFSANGETLIQTNHYYDTEDYHFSSQGITCRIREMDNHYTATIKVHNYDGIQHHSFERTRRVQDQWDTSLFKDLDVQYQGCMITRRTVIKVSPDITVMLDQNTYLDSIDYELEIEYSSDFSSATQYADSIAELLLAYQYIETKHHFLNRIATTSNKFSRFIKKKLKN